MAGTFDAGSVIYEVDMDTSRLLAARREVDAALHGALYWIDGTNNVQPFWRC